MESRVDEENEFSDVIENLSNMFGDVMSKDVISTVVESCAGDLNLSMDAIMNITSDGNGISKEEVKSSETKQSMAVPQSVQSTTSTYASAAQFAQSTGAIPKHIQRPIQQKQIFWTNQIREIITQHNQGSRILIIMRGAPGSGKSYLAKQLVDMMIGSSVHNYNKHIFSTDDFFMVGGQYVYEKYRLTEAHMWNQNRVREATRLGVSPVIVDNTNIDLWEMEPYVREGVRNGYIIQLLEPTTPWAKKANQLVKRNIHNVPFYTIKRMLDNYCNNVTGETLIHSFGLSYPPDMIPPIKRTLPPIPTDEAPALIPDPVEKECSANVTAAPNDTNIHLFPSSTSTLNIETQPVFINQNPEREDAKNLTTDIEIKTDNKSDIEELVLNNTDYDFTYEEQERQKLFLEAQNRLELFQKVEEEWENGEHWDDDDQAAAISVKSDKISTASAVLPAGASTVLTTAFVPEAKPQRKPCMSPPLSTDYEPAESLIQTVTDCQDWSKISMFMPPWAVPHNTSTSVATQEVPIETVSISTCMEIGDTDVNGKNKVITATSRNINEFHISFQQEKIPQKRMLDKSTMTNEGIITEAFRCSNEEKHFVAFRKLFKNIARSDLRDIFDKCCGDVNWAVEIVLDGMNNNEIKTVATEKLSDAEEESTEQCECLANYHIIPDVATSDSSAAVQSTSKKENIPTNLSGSQPQKKKRDAILSDENIQIKRQIEQNVVISDNHYSQHCLKIRKMRRGENDTSENVLEEPGTSSMSAEASEFVPNYTYFNVDASDENEDSSVKEVDGDKIVNVTFGSAFIAELDEMFGRKDMQYPAYILPKVSLPMSMLYEINALWMESLTYQIDEHAERTAAMVQQDEEFARQIAMKEAELSLAGKEPEVPDFKEIMDMDLALALYKKDVDEWRNSLPTDMAAKMTRDKLYNLFPDVDKDTLTELLMAYDNNFKATVEVLLMSTGRIDILETENGVNKFVAENELQQKDKILKQQKKELSEAEWPLLSKDHKVDMSTIEAYRLEADQHLLRRNQNFQKAQDYIRRGMTQVANYYSEIANFHKQKYEHANSLAVASLMQFHALNNPDCTTIDLHYLRVKEAKESLDIFIDTHVSKLRDAGNHRNVVLFFITGRGNHSQGHARIKPATIIRLRERGLGYVLKNPGLLSATVNANTKLTYQVSVP